MNTDELLNMLIDTIDYSFLQSNGDYDKSLTYPVTDKVKYIKKKLKNKEVKEVDLKKEYDDFQDPTIAKLVNRNAGIVIAKHFFELGIKAQKGE